MTAVTDTPYGRPAQSETYTVVTVLLLVAGGFVVPVVGWLAGVVMLWAGERWGAGAKWLGTVVWPAVIAVPALAVGVTGLVTDSGGWVLGVGAVVGLVTALAFLPWVFVHLLREGRR